MKKILLWLGMFLYLISMIGCVYIAFSNPKETHQELMINHWREYLVCISVFMLGAFLMRIGDKDK